MFPKYTFSKAGGAVLMLVSIRGLVLGNLEISSASPNCYLADCSGSYQRHGHGWGDKVC